MFQIPKVQLFKFQSYILKFSHFLQMCNVSNSQSVQLENVKIFRVGVMPLDGIQAHYHNKTNTQLSPCEMTSF